LTSLDLNSNNGPNVDASTCSQQTNEQWIWNATDGTVQNKNNSECLTVQQELEIWAGPLSDGSQAVVLLN
jgi:hypothetical protein